MEFAHSLPGRLPADGGLEVHVTKIDSPRVKVELLSFVSIDGLRSVDQHGLKSHKLRRRICRWWVAMSPCWSSNIHKSKASLNVGLLLAMDEFQFEDILRYAVFCVFGRVLARPGFCGAISSAASVPILSSGVPEAINVRSLQFYNLKVDPFVVVGVFLLLVAALLLVRRRR